MDNYITDIKFNGIIEISTSNIKYSILDDVSNEIRQVFKKYNINYENYELMTLNKKKYSITQCEKCNSWMVNRDKNPLGINQECFFEFIHNGGFDKDKELCEMCLPDEHRWA